MALTEIPLPYKGVNESLPLDKTIGGISPYMNNVWPFDVLDRRIRIGQRPGMGKAYSQQIGGDANPIVAMIIITTVD